jgi:hypothetical protein
LGKGLDGIGKTKRRTTALKVLANAESVSEILRDGAAQHKV